MAKCSAAKSQDELVRRARAVTEVSPSGMIYCELSILRNAEALGSCRRARAAALMDATLCIAMLETMHLKKDQEP